MDRKQEQGNVVTCDNDYELLLQDSGAADSDSDNAAAVRLRAVIREHIEYRDYHEIVTYEIAESQGIAFDHAKIITSVFHQLRRMLGSDIRIAFDFMPEYFTLTDLQEAVELISGSMSLRRTG